jgi:hypothetical protein
MMAYKFKPLQWVSRSPGCWIADTPSTRTNKMLIMYEEGMFWADWDLELEAKENPEDLMKSGQDYHDRWLTQFILPYTET